MQTGLSTTQGMFDGTKIFNIPIYQRAYAWDDSNLNEFLTDIKTHYGDKPYFLGTFLFHKTITRNEFSVYDVVDGQQRITTFILFMNSLINKLVENGSKLVSSRAKRIFVKDDDVFKIELQNEDTSFLFNRILSGPIPTADYAKTPSQRLLIMARKFFEDSLVGLNLEDLERFYKISTSAEVLLYVVENLESATQIFELLNDRGRKLTDLESIKSFLMYNIGKLTDNSDQIIKSIQAEFVEIYREIEAKEIDDRDVLRYHCIGFEKCPDNMREKPKEFIKAKFQGLISVGNREHAKEEIIQFSSRLRESFQIFGQILEERFNNEKLANVYMIGRVAPFYPVLMAKKKLGKESYDNALSSIRDFTFRASLASLRSNGESYFYTSLRNDQDPIEKIISFIADNQWDINKRVEDGLEYKNFYFGFPKHFLRYILVSYENLLRSKKGFPKITLREFFTDIDREKISIEHITAQRAKNVTFDDDFKVEYMNDLGNLVLDFAGSNSSKGNDNTLDKLPQYQNAPIMSQNEILDVKLNWSNIEEIKQFITDRSKRLRAFIKAELMKS